MFDHLTPIKDIKIKKARNKVIDLAVYFFLLIWAIFLGVFSNLANHSPKAIALATLPDISINSLGGEQKIVSIYTPQLNLFNFNIENNKEGTELNKLRIYLNGLYSLEFYNSLEDNLKLYANGTQLGNISIKDKQGYLSFTNNNYPLLLGDNYFSLILESNNLTVNDIIQLSLETKEDIILSYNNNIFYPSFIHPLEGSLFSFLNKGYLDIYNLNTNNNIQLSKTEIPLASFLIASTGEVINLKEFIISSDSELDNSTFYLKNNDTIISTGQIINNNIVFSLDNFKLNPHRDSSFQITGILEEGEYSFSLIDIIAQGFFSSQDINLKQEFFLNKLNIKNSFLSFSSQDIDNTTNEDQNIIYNLNIKSLGKEVKLNSLVWDFKGTLSDLKVLIDNKYQDIEIDLKDNKLSIEDIDLIIPLTGLNLKLEAKVLEDYLQIYLLENNIYNLPLAVNILKK